MHAGDDRARRRRLLVNGRLHRAVSVRLVLSVLVAGLVPVAGCGESDAPAPIPPHLSSIETEIFAHNCTFSSCHGATPEKDMSLVAPTYATITGVPSTEVPTMMRIAPGDPDGSYLLQKISSPTPLDGVRMPPDQPLAQNKIDAIRIWIAAGALDD
jgi:hypothetical protein